MRSLLAAACAAASIALAPAALAHGEAKARHGGVVQTAHDLGFELVVRGDVVAIYIEDHGKPVAPAGISGRLTVLNGTDKSEATLTAAGDRLEARGVKIAKGARVVAALTTADKKAMTVRFTLR